MLQHQDRAGRVTHELWHYQGREWSNLDRLEIWLREQGISRWQVVNDLEEAGVKRLGVAVYVPPK